MTIEQMRALVAALVAKAQAITAKLEAESREPTDEEQTELTTILADHAKAKTDLEAAEARAKVVSQVNDLVAPAAPAAGAGRQTAAALPAGSDPVNVRVISEPHEGDPTSGYSTPAAFMLDVLQAGLRPGNPAAITERLRPLAAAGSDEQSEFADPYGGFLVPEAFTPNLRMITAEADPMAGRVTSIPMSAPAISFPARVDKTHTSSVSGGLTVSRRAEADTSASSRIEFEKITLQATGLFGISYATEELLTDSPISFASLISQGFSDEFSSKIIDERINGTGVGQFTGVLNAPCVISVAKETGQAADTIVYQNIIKMYARLWGKNNGVWICNHNCLPQLMQMTLDVGTGGVPMWQTSAVPGTPGTLIGLPVIPTEYTKTVGDKGDLILGNWSQYIEGTRQTLTGAESIHVRFTTAERTFRFTMRNDAAPWWRSALTPKNGDTLSPFVVLAARA